MVCSASTTRRFFPRTVFSARSTVPTSSTSSSTNVPFASARFTVSSSVESRPFSQPVSWTTPPLDGGVFDEDDGLVQQRAVELSFRIPRRRWGDQGDVRPDLQGEVARHLGDGLVDVGAGLDAADLREGDGALALVAHEDEPFVREDQSAVQPVDLVALPAVDDDLDELPGGVGEFLFAVAHRRPPSLRWRRRPASGWSRGRCRR